mgnify:CR=1 FL=1
MKIRVVNEFTMLVINYTLINLGINTRASHYDFIKTAFRKYRKRLKNNTKK